MSEQEHNINDEPDGYNALPFKMALPMVAVGTFILALAFALCCYLAKLRKQGRPKVCGYRKVTLQLNKDKDNPLQETKNDTCPICLEEFKNKEVLAICQCRHVFHKKCLRKWLEIKLTCPMCVSDISIRYNHHSGAITTGPSATSIVIPSTVGTPPGPFPSQV